MTANLNAAPEPADAAADAGGTNPMKPAVDFVRDHPVLVVAGGIALGAVAAAFLPRGTGRKLVRRAVQVAEIAGTASAVLGRRAMDTAESTGAGLRERGAAVADKIERLSETAGDRIGQLGDSAGAKLSRTASEIRSRVRG